MSREWKTYACRYFHDGKWWGLDLRALDDHDALARVGKLGRLQLLGELKASIPVPGASIAVRTFSAFRKLLAGLRELR